MQRQLIVDSYEPGEKVTRTEENEETGITTTEITYETNYVEIDAGVLEELVSWKELDEVGETVSGFGTYTTTFEVPEDWENDKKIEFKAESFGGGTAALWINGEQVSVNMDRHTADLTDYVKTGENTIEVRVTTTLRNVMITQGYDGWIFGVPESDDYGMIGKTKIVCHM